MPMLIRNGRSPALRRARLAATTLRAILVAIVAGASGCASAPPSSATLISIRSTEGARWIVAESVEAYGCSGGALVCSADAGRLSERRCRCGSAQ